MKIIFCGTQCNGKTTLVNNFIHNWPMYKTPTKTYRDIIKEKNLKINKEATVDSQRIIRDVILDQLLEFSSEKYVVFDRSIIDNIAYTLYNTDKGNIKDDKFIAESIHLCRESLKLIDIIFWLPLNSSIILSEREQREVDPVFREEIDAIFGGIYDSYRRNENLLFDTNNQPAFIQLEGDIQTKIDIISEYIDENGNVIETTESVLSTLQDEYDKLDFLNSLR